MNILRTLNVERCVSRAISVVRQRFSPSPIKQLAIALTVVSILFLSAGSARASTFSGYDGLEFDNQGVCSSVGGDPNDFDKPHNWDSSPCVHDGTVPSGGIATIPAVFVAGRAVICHRALSLSTLNLQGELDDTSTVTITGAFNFTSGILNAPLAIPVGATMTISGADEKIHYGNTNNQGTVKWNGSNRFINAPGIFTNTASGIIDLRADGPFGEIATLNNFGTIKKSVGSGTSQLGADLFTNKAGGIISASSGVLEFTTGERVNGGGGTNTQLDSGTNLTTSGTGKVLLSNVCNLTGTINVSGALVINIGGTVGDGFGQQITGVATFKKVGTGSISWQGGGFRHDAGDANKFTFGTIGDGLVVTIEGPADKVVGNLINNGIINWKNGGRLNGFGSSVLTNNGTLDIQGDDLIYDAALFTNNGTAKKSVGTGTTNFNQKWTNNGAGIIDMQKGTLEIGGGLNDNPNIFNSGTTIQGAGRLLQSGSTKFIGAINVKGNLELGAFHNQFQFSSYSGTPTFSGTGLVDWTSGNFTGTGTLATFGAGLGVTIEGAGDKGGDAPIFNNTIINWKGGAPVTASTFNNKGTFNVMSANTFYGTFKNTGALNTFPGDTVVFANTLSNSGVVNVGGAGTIGTLYAQEFTQTAAGQLNMDIGGAADGAFDVLQVVGSPATFAGKLNAFLINSYAPPVDAAFKVATFGTRSGKFASVGTSGGGTKTLSALYNPNDLTLTTQQLNLSLSDVRVVEGNSGVVNAVFNVTLSPASSQTVTVNYATQNGTATQPADYAVTSATLTFAPGETTKTITVPVKGDLLDEDDETFLVNLSGAAGALIAKAQGIGTIADDDATPSVAINDITVTEGSGGIKNAVFTVTLSARSGRNVGITCVTADGTARTPADYTASRVNLTFTPGETALTKTFSVPVITDTTDEVNEVFYGFLSLPVNVGVAKGRGIATINDDDLSPKISIDDVSIGEGNGGTRSAVFHLTLSQKSGKVVTVNFSTAAGTIFPAKTDSDYVAVAPTPVSFSAGTTIALVRVLINGDVLDEENETFKVNLSSPVEASILDGQGIGTILDDDTSPSLSIDDISVSEGDAGSKNLVLTVTQSAISAKTVTVNYATADGIAKAASDYTATNGTLTFAPGSALTRTIVIPISGDVLAEADETFYVFLSAATNASIGKARGVGTILNDDASG